MNLSDETQSGKLLEHARKLLRTSGAPLPDDFSWYDSAVSAFVNTGDKAAAISLALDVDRLGNQGDTDRVLALYPILRAFVDRFGASPELLLELYVMGVGLGGGFLQEAPAFLEKAFTLQGDNGHVLWELWGSYVAPYFPGNLRLGQSDIEHETECIRRILKTSPSDDFALVVRNWIETRNKPYVRSRDVPVPVWRILKERRPSSGESLASLLTSP